MMRSAKLLTLVVILGGSIRAQVAGVGSFGGGGDPFATFDNTMNTDSTAMWRPWLSANGNYTKTLSSSQSNDFYAPDGGALSGGIGGYKRWESKQVTGGYTGSVFYRPNPSPSTGPWRSSQTANLSYFQKLNRRLSISLQQLGGFSHGGYGFASGYGVNGVPGVSSPFGAGGIANGGNPGAAGLGDTGINGFVDNEIFSSRVSFYLSSAGLSYRVSQRFALNFSGGASLVRRDQGFRGINSYNAGVSGDYQISARTIIGAGASLFTNSYTDLFGNVRGENYYGAIRHQFNETTDLSVQAGVVRLNSKYIGAVLLPPEVAEILGMSTSLEVTRTDFLSPTFGLRLNKTFAFGRLAVAGNRGLGMGNGVVMAGMRDIVSFNFGRSLTPRMGMGITAGYVRASGRVGVQRSTETAQGGGVLSYHLGRGFSLSGQMGIRYLGSPGWSRNSGLYVGGGINWSPGDQPFVY